MDEASGDMGSPESLSTQRSQSAERRRLPRIPVLHPAVLQASGLPDVQCEIRDYCSGGLFLRVNDRSIALHRFEARIGAPIRVLFVPPHQFQAMRVAVEGVIVRVAETGLGISLRGTMPLDALQILKEAEQPAPGPAPAKGDPKIIQACRNSLTAVLPELFEKFSGTINETLLDAADAAQSGWEQMEFFDARSLFASVPMLEEYRRQALIQVDNNQIVHGPENEPQPADGLSLVDANLFEDWLNLRTEMAKLETSTKISWPYCPRGCRRWPGFPSAKAIIPTAPWLRCCLRRHGQGPSAVQRGQKAGVPMLRPIAEPVSAAPLPEPGANHRAHPGHRTQTGVQHRGGAGTGQSASPANHRTRRCPSTGDAGRPTAAADPRNTGRIS